MSLNLTQPKHKFNNTLKVTYIKLMMKIISSGLVSASHHDKEIQDELKGLTPGQYIQMLVMPNVAQFTVKVTEQHTLQVVSNFNERADLTIKFKHASLAFLVFSFQESTALSFARDRMVADGNLSDSVRIVRCLNRLEALILPKFIAELAVKEYPQNLSLTQKIAIGTKVYAGLAKNMVTG